MQTSIILCVLVVSTLAILANGNFDLHLILPLTPQDYITNHAYSDLTPFPLLLGNMGSHYDRCRAEKRASSKRLVPPEKLNTSK